MTPPLGERVRAVRTQRGMSLRKLAEGAGVSPSLISQIENGKTQPSVQTLYAIVHCLDTTVDQLTYGPAQPTGLVADGVGDPPGAGASAAKGLPRTTAAPSTAASTMESVVRRADEHRKIEMETGVTWEQLAGWGNDDVESILVTYPPGSSSSVEGRLSRHRGTEYAYLIEGTLTLHLEFDTYELAAGSSLHFDSTRPHMYVNESDEPARGIWFQLVRRDRWPELDGDVGDTSFAAS